jgi:hypothetical protein
LWDTTELDYGINSSTQILPIYVTYPGRTTGLTWTFPNIVIGLRTLAAVFGYNLSILQASFANYYTNTYPPTFSSDRWVSVAPCRLGRVAEMMTVPFGQIRTTPNCYSNAYWAINQSQEYTGAAPRLCLPIKQVIEAVIYGMVPIVTTDPLTDTNPLFVDLGPNVIDPQIAVQQAINSSTNSQYQNFLQAQLSTSKSPYAATMEMLDISVNDVTQEVSNTGTPDYSSLSSYVQSARSALSSVVQEALPVLRPYSIRMAGQGAAGLLRHYLYVYLAYRARAARQGRNGNANDFPRLDREL